MDKWVIKKGKKAYVWFSTGGRYMSRDEWKKACEELGRQKLVGGGENQKEGKES